MYVVDADSRGGLRNSLNPLMTRTLVAYRGPASGGATTAPSANAAA